MQTSETEFTASEVPVGQTPCLCTVHIQKGRAGTLHAARSRRCQCPRNPSGGSRL